jgi:hypothetical protein
MMDEIIDRVKEEKRPDTKTVIYVDDVLTWGKDK